MSQQEYTAWLKGIKARGLKCKRKTPYKVKHLSKPWLEGWDYCDEMLGRKH